MTHGAIRKARAGFVLLSVALLLLLVGPLTGDAQAATRCAGRKVDTLTFSTGSVHVYRSGGFLCAMTYAKHPGTTRSMSVSIQARGSRAVVKSGRAKKSMGPVRTLAGSRKVWIKGSVGGGKVSEGWIRYPR
ncbi:hypothetical protein H9Y04_31045 [Streptomyces sp. TRM66268-LWL]|uniref:Secreted protein n=1 Tax=Streptomyces polyasparticus TaxID=2767826 RepID=A0ABR7SQM9_9ACTN|nr:hypothetical protein [Streptomyces polyasparticus]